jgi:hypothetical protein
VFDTDLLGAMPLMSVHHALPADFDLFLPTSTQTAYRAFLNIVGITVAPRAGEAVPCV